MSTSSDYVTIGSLTVRRTALEVLWALEDRGIHLRWDGDDGILASPRAKMTDADRVALRRWKRHVLALLASFEAGAVH